MPPDPDQLIHAMQRLGLLLADEDAALRAFDLAGIAAAAEAKLALEPQLLAALEGPALAEVSTAQREQLVALRTEVGARARANLTRLRASLDTVSSVVDHLTGRDTGGYGRGSASAPVRAVLTYEVG